MSQSSTSTHTVNTGVVDASGIRKAFLGFTGRYKRASIVDVLDVCTLVEAVILYDRLIMTNGLTFSGSRTGRPGPEPRQYEDPLQAFITAGVLVIESEPSKPVQPARERPDQRWGGSSERRYAGPDSASATNPQDAWYETGRIVGAEMKHQCSAVAMLRQRPYYEAQGQTSEQHSVCDLVAHYSELRDVLLRIREDTRIPMVAYGVAPLPPLALEVFRAASTPGELLVRTLELRDRYARLRDSLRQLRQDLADPRTPPTDKLKAIRSWERSWATLNQHKQAGMIEIANATVETLDIRKSLDTIGIDSLKLDKILQRAIELSAHLFYRWRVRLLHDSARNYLRTSDHGLNSEVRRFIGRELTEDDYQLLRQLGVVR
jgi:hypothetical protein